MADILDFPQSSKIDPYLADGRPQQKVYRDVLPHITLTYATSLDSLLSARPGVQTALSGPESKAMTHHLRSRHDAILIGSGTAMTDDSSLNCRIRHAHSQPRPVILDRRGRWDVTPQSKVVRLAREGKGKAPWMITSKIDKQKQEIIEAVGGRLIEMNDDVSFKNIAIRLFTDGIRSVMVEGGAAIINDLLSPANRGVVENVIVTIAPKYLGQGGVSVSPPRAEGESDSPVVTFDNVAWLTLGQDVVMLGRMPQK